jgi:formamidopyrimidine-DNA glycosylase
MPEGHSLELAARRLQPIVGQPVLSGPLSGARVEAVEARGKHLLVHGDGGRSLDVHLGMHGRVRLAGPGTGRGRFVLRTPAADVVIAGRLRMVDTARGGPPLGPDLLHGRFDAAEYLRRMRLIDRPLAEALLDQRVLAGIGNIVRCEALWQLACHPLASARAVPDRLALELAAVSRRMLRAGVAAGGPLPSRVHRRAGRPCPRCGGPIASRPLGEQRRRLYWCPGCQVRR